MPEISFHPAARAEAVAAAAYHESERMLVFRYSVIVATTNGQPMVYAVAHQGREPGYWIDRLG